MRIIVNITVIINRGTNKFEDYSEALSMEVTCGDWKTEQRTFYEGL